MIRRFLIIGHCYLIFVGLAPGRLPAQTGSSAQAIYSKVPAWLFESLTDPVHASLAIGISDPGLPDSVARQQAFLRGIAMGAMAAGSKGAHLGDLFTREQNLQADMKYEEIYRFTSDFAGDLRTVQLLSDTILRSGEAILALALPASTTEHQGDSILSMELFLYNHEFEVDGKQQLLRKYEFTINLWTGNDLYNLDHLSFYRLNRKATGIECSMPRSLEAYTTSEYYYGMPGSGKQHDSLQEPGTSTCQGLWIALLSQLLDQVSFCVKEAIRETEKVSDQTQHLTLELNREKEKLFLNWKLNRLIPGDQKLTLDLSCGLPVFNH